MARPGPGLPVLRLPRNVPSRCRRRSRLVAALALVVLATELITLAVAPPAGAQEVKPPVTVDGPGPCRRIGGDWLQPGYCEITGPLRVGPDDDLVLAVGAFLLGPVEIEGRLEVRGDTSLVFFFGDLAVRGHLAVTDGGVAYLAGRAESPGGVELSGGGRMEILSDSGSLSATGRFHVAGDGRLDVYGTVDNQGELTNLGVVAVWCGGALSGAAPVGVAVQAQDCVPPEVSLVSRTPTDAGGWNRGTVTVVWACTDQGSGVVAERVTVVLSGDGVGQSAFGVCTDLAGNTAAGVVTGINIERPAPRTRRRPAPPVVVHLEPAAPAPPPPAPPPPVPAPAAGPAAVPPTAVPEAAPAGPSITDPVSSPDPAPPLPAPTPPPASGPTSLPVPLAAAPTSTSESTSPAMPASTATSTSPSAGGPVPVTGTATSAGVASSAPAPTTPPTAPLSPTAAASPVAPASSAFAPAGPVGPATTGAAVGVAATTTTLLATPVASPTTIRTGGAGPPG